MNKEKMKKISVLFYILFVICLLMTGIAMTNNDLTPSVVFSVWSLILCLLIIHLDNKLGGK